MSAHFNIGLYAVPEAARLARMHPNTVYRWIDAANPVVRRTLDDIEGRKVISFSDLMELRVARALSLKGVPTRRIRTFARVAADRLDTPHPFSSRRFFTDGRTLFLREDRHLTDLRDMQMVIEPVIKQYLCDLEFDADTISRWFPLGLDNKVIVLDPRRNFGAPTLDAYGVPTSVVSNEYRLTRSIDEVADAYEIDLGAVRAVLEFDRLMAA